MQKKAKEGSKRRKQVRAELQCSIAMNEQYKLALASNTYDNGIMK